MSNLYSYEVDKYLKENEKAIGVENINTIRSLIQESNIPISRLYDVKLKSPTTATVLAVLLGYLGVDRFYAGDYIHGVIKLLTQGIYLIDWIIDIVIISKRIKAKNIQAIEKVIIGKDIDVSIKFNKDTVEKVLKDQHVRQAAKDLVHATNGLRDSFDINN